MKHLARLISFSALLFLVSLSLSAQVSTGTIAGNVADPSGAAVANASVVITNTDTGIVTRTVTSATGLYSVPNLQTGPYSVTVAVSGFSEQIADNVQLNVGAQQEINFALKPGGVNEKIIVTTTPPTLDFVTSTNMPVVDEKTIVELPLNGRDYTALANLQPGVAGVRTQPALAVSNQRANRGVGNQLTIGGARPQQNNYRTDGISINDYSNGKYTKKAVTRPSNDCLRSWASSTAAGDMDTSFLNAEI